MLERYQVEMGKLNELRRKNVFIELSPVNADDALEVSFEEHDALARPQVPDAPERVHAARRAQRTVVLSSMS